MHGTLRSADWRDWIASYGVTVQYLDTRSCPPRHARLTSDPRCRSFRWGARPNVNLRRACPLNPSQMQLQDPNPIGTTLAPSGRGPAFILCQQAAVAAVALK